MEIHKREGVKRHVTKGGPVVRFQSRPLVVFATADVWGSQGSELAVISSSAVVSLGVGHGTVKCTFGA